MKQPSQIFDWVKTLTMKQRDTLAGEVSVSGRYLSTLATSKSPISIELAHRLLDSKTNKALPKKHQLKLQDFTEYMKFKVNQ